MVSILITYYIAIKISFFIYLIKWSKKSFILKFYCSARRLCTYWHNNILAALLLCKAHLYLKCRVLINRWTIIQKTTVTIVSVPHPWLNSFWPALLLLKSDCDDTHCKCFEFSCKERITNLFGEANVERHCYNRDTIK